MKRLLLIITLFSILTSLKAQEEGKPTLYDTSLNGMEQLDKAIKQADVSGKHVFVQLGGNWCGWCILFNKFVNEDQELKDFLESNYVVVHLNYSRENKNEESLKRLEFPNRFGYPVFIILDGSGKRIHTQNSALLEEGKGYNRDDVMNFFKAWTVAAVDPATYKK